MPVLGVTGAALAAAGVKPAALVPSIVAGVAQAAKLPVKERDIGVSLAKYR